MGCFKTNQNYLGRSFVWANLAGKALLLVILSIMRHQQLLRFRFKVAAAALVLFGIVFDHMTGQGRSVGAPIITKLARVWPLLGVNPLMELDVVLDTAGEVTERALERLFIAMLRAYVDIQT